MGSNAETIINEWIETAKDLGRTIPKPKRKLMTVAFKFNGFKDMKGYLVKMPILAFWPNSFSNS
jgi:hypothetical protein